MQRLAARPFGVVAELLQLGYQTVAVIALDLYGAVLHGASGAAQLFEACAELVERRTRQRQSGDDRDALAAAAGDLPADPHPGRAGLRHHRSATRRLEARLVFVNDDAAKGVFGFHGRLNSRLRSSSDIGCEKLARSWPTAAPLRTAGRAPTASNQRFTCG